MRATLDTNIFPIDDLDLLIASSGVECFRATTTDRENPNRQYSLERANPIRETGLYGEARFGSAVYASGESRLDEILKLISNGSFPKSRSELSEGELHQLRDALIFDAHVRSGNEIFVTKDETGFLKNGRRQAFQTRSR